MNQEMLFEIQQEQKTSDDHYTPKWLFDKMDVEFDMDVASPPEGIPYIKAKKYLSQKENGLVTDWSGFVWCNPPYSNVEPWVKKMKEHRNGIMLLPSVKSFWRLEVWNDADGICEPDGVD